MSRIRWLGLLVKAVTMPPIPAGTSAALARTEPSTEFRVETVGWFPPPHNERKPSGAGGTTVAFNENACAPAGTVQADDGTAKLRDWAAPITGPPKAPANPRVSAMRQG